jgi:hypothetical protein
MSLDWKETAEEFLSHLMDEHKVPRKSGWDDVREMAEANLEEIEQDPLS